MISIYGLKNWDKSNSTNKDILMSKPKLLIINGALNGNLGNTYSFFKKIDLNELKKHERKLAQQFISLFEKEEDVVIYGAKEKLNSIVSFNIKNCHHSDVAQLLDQQGVAVRAGHHCTQPLMKYLKIPGTVRVSFSIYNQESDVEKLAKAIQKAKELLL